MEISLTEQEAADLARATATARQVRQWRRYRAIQLLAQGQSTEKVVETLGCSLASLYNWVHVWQQVGLSGLQEPIHAGRTRLLNQSAEQLLEQWLASDPQAFGEQTTGWTVPLLHTRLTTAGYPISQRTLRRTLHRLGWRWKRPKYVLGRPDPAYAEKKARWSRGFSRSSRPGARSG
jgi:transposase